MSHKSLYSQGRKFKENLAEASAFGARRSCGWGSGRPPPENFKASGDENQKPMTCEKHNSLLCLDLSFFGWKCSRGSCRGCLILIYGPVSAAAFKNYKINSGLTVLKRSGKEGT